MPELSESIIHGYFAKKVTLVCSQKIFLLKFFFSFPLDICTLRNGAIKSVSFL